MVCIYCTGTTKIINSRHQKRLNQKWRRHKCAVCAAVFTTIEAFDPSSALSVSNSKQIRPFQREELFVSIYESLRHRPSAAQDAKALTDTIIARLAAHAERATVSRQDIVAVASDTLKHFDKAAFTHYVAFHGR